MSKIEDEEPVRDENYRTKSSASSVSSQKSKSASSIIITHNAATSPPTEPHKRHSSKSPNRRHKNSSVKSSIEQLNEGDLTRVSSIFDSTKITNVQKSSFFVTSSVNSNIFKDDETQYQIHEQPKQQTHQKQEKENFKRKIVEPPKEVCDKSNRPSSRQSNKNEDVMQSSNEDDFLMNASEYENDEIMNMLYKKMFYYESKMKYFFNLIKI